jgi:hypothetical protein
MIAAPARTEAAEYYFRYIDQVAPGDIVATLERQAAETSTLLQSITEEQSLHRYAPDKWTIREVLSHINDSERVFAFRALWFARGFDSPLPSYDQEIAMAGAHANGRSWSSHVEDFRAVRAATLTLFQDLAPEVWDRQGMASGNSFTVRALAYIAAGHVTHHLNILNERYLPAALAIG